MVNLNKKFVRVTSIRKNKYIEFDFAINDPEIFVELILPLHMFDAFCKDNKVELLPPAEQIESEEYEKILWRVGDIRKTIFKS